eukprot:1259580-Rhodomonas_salina.1
MQDAQACRHCIREAAERAPASYASALRPCDVEEGVRALEERQVILPFFTFVCAECMRVSVFSYNFHRLSRERAGAIPYSTPQEYYRSVLLMTPSSASNGPCSRGEHEEAGDQDG